MYVFLVILAFAFLIEAVWERLQEGIPEKYRLAWVKIWGAVVLSVLACIFYRVDLVAAVLAYFQEQAGVDLGVVVGFTVAGAIITGVLISRGADFTHKLLVSLFSVLDWIKHDKAPLDSDGEIGGNTEPVDFGAGLGG